MLIIAELSMESFKFPFLKTKCRNCKIVSYVFIQGLFFKLNYKITIIKFNQFISLALGGLSEEVNKDIIHAAFIPFGEIIDIQIPLDYETRIL